MARDLLQRRCLKKIAIILRRRFHLSRAIWLAPMQMMRRDAVLPSPLDVAPERALRGSSNRLCLTGIILAKRQKSGPNERKRSPPLPTHAAAYQPMAKERPRLPP